MQDWHEDFSFKNIDVPCANFDHDEQQKNKEEKGAEFEKSGGKFENFEVEGEREKGKERRRGRMGIVEESDSDNNDDRLGGEEEGESV